MPTTAPSPNAIATPNVGSSASVQVVGANVARVGLYVFNPSATATLWVAPIGVAAAAGGAGSLAVQPLQGIMLGPPTMAQWTQGLNAIASVGATNAITLLEFTQ